MVSGIGHRLPLDGQRVGLELVASQVGELVLVPCGSIVERKLRRTVGY